MILIYFPAYENDDMGACGRQPVPEDSYYCKSYTLLMFLYILYKYNHLNTNMFVLTGDQELVERLMLEAKALNSWYGTDTWDLREKKEYVYLYIF